MLYVRNPHFKPILYPCFLSHQKYVKKCAMMWKFSLLIFFISCSKIEILQRATESSLIFGSKMVVWKNLKTLSSHMGDL